ncbi:S-adenosyl-L-methionine-dependent methyltransferase [Dunaliella salina]|uniref:S-adenosyl-L-methionine-dependent methyltransferase n=1 Tax=Dunaliella salina TaxID=3046 RepID=A0ABQ7FYK5_DUNSA|nr:S-adenosyl-L-methionine-dependent methyltransferase [Dunaliella salina]|eukprot:KAF5827344.1 S-adenosyl-L-methionine-dependent methyltransferase [Dunaliella salina]
MIHAGLPSSNTLVQQQHQRSLHNAPALRTPQTRTRRRTTCACQPKPTSPKCSSDGSSTGRRALLLVPSIAWTVNGLSMGSSPALADEDRASAIEAVRREYDRFAPKYDAENAGKFDDLRKQLVGQAYGDVLEIGVGTGLNLPFYDYFDKVRSVTGVDISRGMIIEGSKKKAFDPLLRDARIQLFQEDAAQLPQDDVPSASYDSIVSTFSLGVMPDPPAVLKEMVRAVKPGGKILLLEQTRSDNPLLGAYQSVSSKGRNLDLDIPALLEQAGLQSASVQRYNNGSILMAEVQVSK